VTLSRNKIVVILLCRNIFTFYFVYIICFELIFIISTSNYFVIIKLFLSKDESCCFIFMIYM